jgi:ADP-ribose pyrophosphatase YjhB (NUDIX family)
VPGGALDFGESAEDGARREVAEELGMGLGGVAAVEYVDAVSEEWAYTTVVVEVDEMEMPSRFDWETTGCGWFSVQEMSTLKLHPAFRESFWKVLRAWSLGA